ncbi:DUF6569 family protein [Enhydrobacter sp.]|jgi:hypothetical protein|uniref:ARPP-1 family domain-containing protein n=1 Tax=Enhydrobacter sp. TaxID=1894999 RepID=UPI002601A155|nr:DUF6569 family protein [Enhydrobacter sp.]WIM10073.1 MAG: hypothetical protein OJF58_001026 [Enhydrobacter sp.]
MPVTEIANLASRISFGEVQAFRNLALVPLLDRARGPAGYLALDEALRRGQTEITEVSESGSVPQLKLRNRGPEEVFLLDGEELVGAKQNRILNLSILVPAHAELEIPVSCVEQGRWSWRGRGFRGSDRVIFSKLRRSNAESVSANLAEQNSRAGDQRGVWKYVSDKSKRMSVHSDTGAASALFERYQQDLDEFVSELKPVPGQVGAAFLVNGRFAGLDILAGPDLLARLLPKLVRSYALDAMDDETNASTDGSTRSAAQSVERVIAAIGRMSAEAHPAIGRGQDLRLRGAGLVGAALTGDGAMIHLGIWSAAYR